MAQGAVTGALASLKDADFFQYRNLRDYAVSLRVELQPKPPGQMRLMLHFADGREQKFERSAPSAEIAENVRLESGDQLFLAVRPGAAVKWPTVGKREARVHLPIIPACRDRMKAGLTCTRSAATGRKIVSLRHRVRPVPSTKPRAVAHPCRWK